METKTYTVASKEWDGSPSKTYTVELDATLTGDWDSIKSRYDGDIKYHATWAVNEIREAAGNKALNYSRVQVQEVK